jgi:hypothetical protein
MQLRGELLGVLNGAVAGLLEVLVALRLLLREHQRRLRLIHLRLVGADLRLLHVELGVDVLDTGLRGRNLGLRLFEGNAIVAVVDAGNHLASGEMLVIGDRETKGNGSPFSLPKRGVQACLNRCAANYYANVRATYRRASRK